MKLSEIKKMLEVNNRWNIPTKFVVDMGYKFKHSRVMAVLESVETRDGFDLCTVVPKMILEDRCGYTSLCLDANMLVEVKQLLSVF